MQQPQDSFENGGASRGAILGLLLLLVGVLPFLDVAIFGFPRCFRYLAADSFYYMTVAANVPAAGTFSYDLVHPTNGFHPLWQAVLAAAWLPIGATGGDREVFAAVALGISWIALAAGVLLVARAALPHLGRAGAWLLLLPTGFMALATAWTHARYATLWNSINGMESGLSVLLFGATTLAWARTTRGARIVEGVCLGLLVLSRLDLVFALPACALARVPRIVVAPRDRRWRAAIECAVAPATAAAMVAAYMAANLAYAGTAFPVSGSLKSTFPRIDTDKIVLLREILQAEWASLSLPLLWRYAQMAFPLTLAAAWGCPELNARVRGISDDGPWREFLRFCAILIAFVHGYCFLFVQLGAIGHWYYSATQVASTLLVIDLVVGGWRPESSRRLAKANARAIAVTLVALQTLYFVLVFALPVPLHDRLGLNHEERRERFAETLADRSAALAHFGGDPPPIVEFDDGIVAYTLGSPAISGTGFCGDVEAVEAYRQHRLLRLAWDRGYRHLGSSSVLAAPGFFADPSPAELSRLLAPFHGYLDFEAFAWSIEYVDAAQSYVILRFDKLPEPGS